MTQTITCRNCGADDCKHVTGSTYKCNSCTNIFTLEPVDSDEWHNPENVPADKIPEGWRFLRKAEQGYIHREFSQMKCRSWLPALDKFGESDGYRGTASHITYIVPIDQPAKEEEKASDSPAKDSFNHWEAFQFIVGNDPKGAEGAKKSQLQLIPPVINEHMAGALALGASKYGAWNWRKNKVEIMTYLGAMRRHIDAVIEGENYDKESGVHHLGHVAAGCAIVLDAGKHGNLINNTPSAPQ